MPVFEFVNPDDPAARRKAKSHVARKAHREKRLREIETYQSRVIAVPKSLPSPNHASTSPPGTPQLSLPIRRQRVQERTLPRYAEPQTVLASPESATSSDGDSAATEYSDEQMPSTWVDTYASRVGARPQDSFWTLYSQLSSGDRNLLQWYLVTVPELTFDIAHTGPLNPIRDWVFPLVGDSSAVLHSSLLIGAVNNPSFSQGEKGGSRILTQKGKTISLINQGLQKGPAALKDDILYAVAATALAEDRLGNHAACRTHLDGLRHMIRLRGGIKSLRKNAVLCAALMWAEVSVSNHVVPMAPSQSSNEAPRGAKMPNLLMLETRYEEELFCQFLTRLQRVQLSKRRTHLSVDHHTPGKTDFLFQKGSPLLTMLGDSGLESGVITPISRLNAYNCQIACLLYINLMLCDFHGFPHLMAAFLARLSSLVCKHSQKKIPRASLFVWIFVKELENDDSNIDEIDRLDWLIRMIRVTRRLSQESVQMLHQALLESLRIHEAVDTGMRLSTDLGFLASRIEMGSY